MNQIFCPHCEKEIKPIEYGNGWLWVCCGKVVHNSSRLDELKKLYAESDTEPDDKQT